MVGVLQVGPPWENLGYGVLKYLILAKRPSSNDGISTVVTFLGDVKSTQHLQIGTFLCHKPGCMLLGELLCLSDLIS